MRHSSKLRITYIHRITLYYIKHTDSRHVTRGQVAESISHTLHLAADVVALAADVSDPLLAAPLLARAVPRVG